MKQSRIFLNMIALSVMAPRQLVRSFSVVRRTAISTHLSSCRLYSSASSKDNESSSSSTSQTSEDRFSQYRNKNNREDQVFSAMSKDGGIKVTACTVRNIVNDLMIQHTMTKTPADILGRTIACSLLMANGIQDEQVVQITMNCK
jgi:molecular chaperone Hsp33